MEKQVVLIIGDRFQRTASGFVKVANDLNKQPDAILCLLPKKGLLFYLKKVFRGLKRLKPSRLKNAFLNFLRKTVSGQELNHLRNSWVVKGENSWDLLAPGIDLFDYAKSKNVPLSFSPIFNKASVLQMMQGKPTIFVMYGGGIITDEILNIEGAEFINAHMGDMPRYRGMNVLEWAVLEEQPAVVSVMVMNEKIDGGDVIYKLPIEINGTKNIADLRKVGYEHCYQAMAEGVFKYAKGETQRAPQPKGARYYYRMHGAVRELLQEKISSSDFELQTSN